MTAYDSTPRSENSKGWIDKSGGNPPAPSRTLPQHFPMVPFLSPRGSGDPTIIGDALTAKYGEAALDENSSYFTHSNLLARGMKKSGNLILGKRMIPADATRARVGVAIERVVYDVPQFERNPDGTFKLDSDGAAIPLGTTFPGTKFRWRVYPVDGQLGVAKIKAGDLVGNPGETSEIIPIFEGELPDEGFYGNLCGLRFYGPTNSDRNATDEEFIRTYGQYLYRLQFVEAPNILSTVKPVTNRYSSTFVDFCLGKEVLDESTNRIMSYDSRIPDYYKDEESEWGKPMPMTMHFYDDNIKDVLEKAFEKEQPQNRTVKKAFELNIANGVDVDDVPYYSIDVVGPEESGLYLSDATNMMAIGGADGDMSHENFNKMVGEYYRDLAVNESHELRDRQRLPFRNLYDTGYPLDTKYALIDVMAVFPDVNVTTATQDINDKRNSLDIEYSIGNALTTRYKMHPESTMYGTPAARGTCLMQSGFLPKSTYRKLVPLTYALALKRAAFAGAGNGILRGAKAYDLDVNNVVTELVDVNHAFVPAPMRRLLWAAGITYAQTDDHKSVFIPAVQTIYSDKTSVLLSDIVMQICCYITSLEHPVWRKFVGNSKLTPTQIKNDAAKYFNELTPASIFDNRVRVEIEVIQTALDRELGYAYTPKVKVYANNMALLMDWELETHRMENDEGAK